MAEVSKESALIQWLSYFLLRVRVRCRKRKHTQSAFILSFLITYLLTVGLSVGALLIQIDGQWGDATGSIDSVVAGTTETTLSDVCTTEVDQKQTDPQFSGFVFYGCSNISTTLFVAAKLLETLVPTAITFCGTILILQSDATGRRGYMVFLFVVIAFLVIGGIVLPTVKTIPFLIGYLWILGILCVISVYLSWKVFSDVPPPLTNHKAEPSDGKIVF